ncbi:molybdopterin cofactor-binding domain-containing protein [Aquabacterium sp.]|uniref:molybdopterin cofactor-binding domain-containing protein n=1 Tax=Aquabacterium sp. TaxID=1872578 RepID=UPI002BF7BA07|nr:molybdopterin cofactor-binding domain-containing protein [Aquabacterium sp.]HSW06462.1 molybdopterin cofactor-binding domain-containing protein [Aquabacterium sp.]
MTLRAEQPRSRADFRAASGVLLITRMPPPPLPPAPGQPAAVPADPAEGPEILIAMWDDSSATALNGHVDLGTGLRTALAQLACEELDLPLDQLVMLLGHTASAPNQGATIASASIQIHAAPLRQAAAQARAWLLAEAAARWQLPVEALETAQGQVCSRTDRSLSMSYGDLLQDRHVELSLTADTALKAIAEHQLVGQSIPRLDIPAKARGDAVFVHDHRLPGMLHGRVVRPPYAGVDAGDFVGTSLEAVDRDSIAHIPGIVELVVIGDFIGLVAEREDQAEAAQRALVVRWKPSTPLPPLDDLAQALSANPATRRVLVDEGDVDAALSGAAQRLTRDYVWPYQLHASIGPSCAVAHWQGSGLEVWAGTQNPHVLRADLARLTGLADVQVNVIRLEAAGCYGRNGADDVAADAALLSRAVGRPVRVQLTREQEHAWEPKGAAQLMQVDGGLDAQGAPLAYYFQTRYPSNGAPTLALLLTGTIAPSATAYEMGDRTARPPYAYAAQRIVAHDMAPILRASWLRGVSALPNTFAHESYIDELASAAGVDPVAYRLRHLPDERAAELVRATAERAGWRPHTAPQQQPASGPWLQGQGFAHARYMHSKWPGFGAAWAAWVADVEVHRETGEVHVKRVVVGHDAGLMVNPAGVQQQVHGNVLQTTSRALKERVALDPQSQLPVSREWGSYPILSFREVPVVEVMLKPRPGEAPLGAGESSSVPGTAAIANAIFDATGVRFRQPPFTPEVVRAALNPLPAPAAAVPAALQPTQSAPLPLPTTARPPRRRSWLARGLALAGGLLAAGAALLGWRPTIAPVHASSGASVYSTEAIARGRQLAALGNCAICHTAPGGVTNAGGRRLETPFGTIVSTNLTPDADTGIGRWSFSAFQRAMREGISRDGRHLYPAFPYTAFAKTSDDDLQALYAYLMAQPAVANTVPANALRFPFSLRPLMALWNPLFHDAAPYRPEPAQSAPWNRGAYLVNGLGHCSACHTERNALGAEAGGPRFLGGAMVDGWEAPALSALSRAPLPWTEQAFFDYLRRGHSAEHGVAAGPMAPVIRDLAALPDEDIRAMAHYLASFNPAPVAGTATGGQVVAGTATAGQVMAGTATAGQTMAGTPTAAQLTADAAARAPMPSPAQRLFQGACGACHHDGDGPAVLGRNIPLALSSKLHSDQPDNLIRVMLDGIREPAHPEIGFMAGFRDALDDRQIAAMASYMRQRFAPDKAPWAALQQRSAELRQSVTGVALP